MQFAAFSYQICDHKTAALFSFSRLPAHVAECAMFRLRRASVTVPWFDRPCAYYDAILPIRVLLLKMSNPKVYGLVSLLMDHNDKVQGKWQLK